MKTYQASDLFYSKWKDLSDQVHATVFTLQQEIKNISPDDPRYGHLLIQILRQIRKKPLLVDKINEVQAVDIYNDLSFLNEPWYHFPVLKNKALPFIAPEDHMARHTFDHFIYADQEFSMFIITEDVKYLRRLLVTLYRLANEDFFDKESIEARERSIEKSVEHHVLLQVFYTYAQVRDFVTRRCKKLMPKPVKKTSEDADQEPSTPTGAMWLKLKHRLAETPVFQGFDNAGRSNMYSCLDYLEDLAQQKENAKS